VMPQPIPPVYEPELAAAVILRAAARRERDAFVGGAGKALSVAERISPKLVDVQQRLRGFDDQKTAWPKRADAPHNLYEPLPSDGGVRGDFTRQAHKRSLYQTFEARPAAWSLLAGAALLAGSSMRSREEESSIRVAAARALGLALVGKGLLAALYEG